jgi:hypothetical protein
MDGSIPAAPASTSIDGGFGARSTYVCRLRALRDRDVLVEDRRARWECPDDFFADEPLKYR